MRLAALLTLSGWLVIFFILKATNPWPRLVNAPRWIAERRGIVLAAVLGAGFAVTLVAVWALRAFPNSADEYIYLYQARTYLAGRLWNPLPPHHHLFTFLHIFEKDGKWVGQYPPGWPAILAAFGGLRLPFWIADPIVGVALLWTLSRLGARRAGPLGGIIAPLLMAFTPFFIFNAASYFTSAPTALAGAVFCLAAREFLDQPGKGNALIAGAALGVVGVIRTYDVFVFAIPFAIFFLLRGRRGHYLKAPLIGLAGVPFLIGLLLYQRAITGSALTPVTRWGYPLLTLGFYPTDQFGHFTTPLQQIMIVPLNLIDLACFSSIILLVGYSAALEWIARARRLEFTDLVFPCALVAYLFIEGLGGNRYGPRYYFPAFPMMILTVTAAAVTMLEQAGIARRVMLAETLIILHLFACLVGLGAIAIFFRAVVDERMQIYDEVRAMKLHHAIVIVHSGGGHYAPFTPEDLTRNGLSVSNCNDIIYARDVNGGVAELRGMFPDRAIYIFARPRYDEPGTVKLLEPPLE